jgi:predicted transposase YbfD/YdcC
VLAHVGIGEKSNEIPAARALLAKLGIAEDTIVTSDALHCQKKRSTSPMLATSAGNIRLIVQVKDNQPMLKRAIHHIAAASVPHDVIRIRDRGRNRDEIHTISVFHPASALAGTDRHPNVAAIIQVEPAVATRNPETGLLRLTHKTAFYVANASLTAAIAANATRAHWSIENTSHHVRDVTSAEEPSRIRANPGVIARLRSFAFNILMTSKANASTLSQGRYPAALAGLAHLLAPITIPKR